MRIDGDGWCLIFLFCMIFFLIGAFIGYCMFKRDEKAFQEYLHDKEATRKNFLKEAKIHIRQMTIYELERWLNETP